MLVAAVVIFLLSPTTAQQFEHIVQILMADHAVKGSNCWALLAFGHASNNAAEFEPRQCTFAMPMRAQHFEHIILLLIAS